LADNKIWTICPYANNGRPFLTFEALGCSAPVVVAPPVAVYIPAASVTGQSIKVSDITGEKVTIFGGNLAELVKVQVDGTTVSSVDVQDSQITFVLPSHAAGTVNILILTKTTHLTFQDAITFIDKSALVKPAAVTPVKKPVKKPLKKPVKKVIKKNK
jgi:hypothetical protein